VLIADSSVPDETFNIITLTRFASDAIDRRVAETIDVVRATGRPFAWWVDPFAPAELAVRLEAAGLKESGRSPIMRADLAAAPTEAAAEVAQPADGELEIRRVTTERELADFAQLVADCWDPPARTVVEFFDMAARGLLDAGESGENPVRTFVGYLRGVPVCSAQAMPAEGVAGLYNIATNAEYRRRGFGAAMTVAAMRDARAAGYRTVVLEASPMGEPIYRRLGFVTCGQILEYTVEPG
jgi:ribosomal protein S18 acetylase RimI-like enzyme